MNSKRTCFWILTLLLAVPMLTAGAPAAPYQGGGYGGGQEGGGRRGPMSPDDQLKRLTKDFNLTTDQQTKIKPILVDAEKKMEDVRNDSSGDRQTMRQKLMQIRQDTNDQVRALLDDKQKEKFDKQEQERQDRMQNRTGFTACGKTQIFVIPRRATRRGISLFLHLDRRDSSLRSK